METKKKKSSKELILNIFTCFFALLSLLLGFMIYAKKDANAKFLKEHFNIDANFVTFNEKVNDALNSVFTFGIVEKNDNDKAVSNEIKYLIVGDNLYKTVDNQIQMIDKGIILGTYKEMDEKYSVIVSYNNGIVASYSNLSSLKVKTYDQLKESEVIGTYCDNFKALFKKDGKLINYNEIRQ